MNDYIKLIFGLCIMLVFVSVLCWFWYQWDTALYRKEAAETRQRVEQFNKQSKVVGVPSKIAQARKGDAPISDSVEQVSLSTAPSTTQTDTVVGTNDMSLPKSEIPEPETTETVVVSPFGFGPYPQIPPGFPEPDIFESLQTMGHSDMRKAFELQKRLIVEFYREGKSLKNVGVSGDADGRVYLNYPDVVYVEWDYWTDENDITHKYAGRANGHPDAMQISKPYLDKGEIPPGITVYELPDGYIDAYEYLGLNR